MAQQVEHQGTWWHRMDDGSIHRFVALNDTWVRWSPGDVGPQPPAHLVTGAPPPPPGSRVTTGTSDQQKTGSYLTLIAGAGIILSLFLPWLSASTAFGGGLSRNAFDWQSGDATIILVLGVVTLLIGIAALGDFELSTWIQRSSIVTGIVVAGLGAYHYIQLQERAESATADAEGFGTATIGSGIYVLFVAAGAAILGGLMRRTK